MAACKNKNDVTLNDLELPAEFEDLTAAVNEAVEPLTAERR